MACRVSARGSPHLRAGTQDPGRHDYLRPVISQIAVEAAIRDNWNYIHAFNQELRTRRSTLASALAHIPSLHWTPTGGGFFAFVRIAGGGDSERLAREILERAYVVTIPGAAFGKSGEGFPRMEPQR
jgi:aspartate/methionine/tyrosine aminotransferase